VQVISRGAVWKLCRGGCDLPRCVAGTIAAGDLFPELTVAEAGIVAMVER
jgi:hypothetical protein